MLNPQVSVPFCADKCAPGGQLADETTIALVRQLRAALPTRVERFH